MLSKSPKVKFTYEDYLLFPDDGKRHELIDGEHYMTPAPSIKHQKVSGNLFGLLHAHLRRTNAGYVFAAPTDVVLSDQDVLQPDLLFVSADRASIITEKCIQGVPDLTVEIISETTRKTDEIMKRKVYERYGVQEYWIVDPELERVKAYRMTPQGYVHADEWAHEAGESLTTPLFPDFQIPLAEIFE